MQQPLAAPRRRLKHLFSCGVCRHGTSTSCARRSCLMKPLQNAKSLDQEALHQYQPSKHIYFNGRAAILRLQQRGAEGRAGGAAVGAGRQGSIARQRVRCLFCYYELLYDGSYLVLRDGWTSLIAAARWGHVGILQLLLDQYVTTESALSQLVNAVDGDRSTALMHASAHGHLPVMRLLIDARSSHFAAVRVAELDAQNKCAASALSTILRC